jgi:hypothetical protein
MQLMTGASNDPKTWAAYEQIYGKPHNSSPEGQAALAGTSPAQQQQANAETYTGFQQNPGNNFYPGRAAVDTAASVNNSTPLGTVMNNPAYKQPLGFGAQTVQTDAAGQTFNDRQYANAPTAQWLAEQLGAEYIPAEDYSGGQAGQMPGAAYLRMPDGSMMNAGLVGQQFQRVQNEYAMQARNYEQNLAQNPNIVGTGFLSEPGNPIDMLKNRLAGTPYSNTNPAGGNAGIRNALGQTPQQNAYGQPLGAGGPNADFPNAPVGPGNPIDQSTQPGNQTQVPPAGDPFAPQGPQPGAGPSGTQNPGQDPNWTGQPGGYTPGGNAPDTTGMNPGGGFPGGGMPGGQQPPGGFNPFGWNPGGGGQPGFAGNPYPQYQQPQNYFQPQSPFGGQQQNPFNPWSGLQGPGGISGLAQLLGNVQGLRNSGYGMFGGWNPMTGFGGGFGPFGGPGGMMGQSPYGSLGMNGFGGMGQQGLGGMGQPGGQWGMGSSSPGGMQDSYQAPTSPFTPQQRPTSNTAPVASDGGGGRGGSTGGGFQMPTSPITPQQRPTSSTAPVASDGGGGGGLQMPEGPITPTLRPTSSTAPVASDGFGAVPGGMRMPESPFVPQQRPTSTTAPVASDGFPMTTGGGFQAPTSPLVPTPRPTSTTGPVASDGFPMTTGGGFQMPYQRQPMYSTNFGSQFYGMM